MYTLLQRYPNSVPVGATLCASYPRRPFWDELMRKWNLGNSHPGGGILPRGGKVALVNDRVNRHSTSRGECDENGNENVHRILNPKTGTLGLCAFAWKVNVGNRQL